MSGLEYAPKGLIGVLTPQANTTVEPELALLMPKGFAWINGRLTSGCATMEDRLRDYLVSLPDAIRQFGNAPLSCIAFACTGACYLAGREAEDAMRATLARQAGVSVITAASAVVDALTLLGAKTIGLVSPYDDSLNRASTAYWTSRGFIVSAKAEGGAASGSFHPIYGMGSDVARRGLDSLAAHDLDAIVMLGTGMPTLAPIAERPRLGRAPVMSCMLCLAWRAVAEIDRAQFNRQGLLAWIAGDHWSGRLPRDHI
jgi:maleate cis-trans isomerase